MLKWNFRVPVHCVVELLVCLGILNAEFWGMVGNVVVELCCCKGLLGFFIILRGLLQG